MNAANPKDFVKSIESGQGAGEEARSASASINLACDSPLGSLSMMGADYALLYKEEGGTPKLLTPEDRETQPKKKADSDSFQRVAELFKSGRYDGIALIKDGAIFRLLPGGRQPKEIKPPSEDGAGLDSVVTPSGVEAIARFTRLCYTQPIGKRVYLDKAGLLHKQTLAPVALATAYIVRIRSIEELEQQFRYASATDVFVSGVPHADGLSVVSRQAKSNADEIARSKENFPFHDGPGLMFFDNDCPVGDEDDQFPIYAKAVPALAAASYVFAPSSSGWIYDAVTGKQLKGRGGQHYAVPVLDASDIPRALEALHDRLILAGFGIPLISRAGAVLIRTPVDKAMRTSNQQLFQRALMGDGLVQRKDEHIGCHRGGTFLFDSRLIADLTADEKKQLEQIKAELYEHVEEQALQVRRSWIEGRVDAVASRNGITRAVAYDCLQAALTRSMSSARFDLIPGIQIKFSSGWVDVGELLVNPGPYDGQACADPFEPDYGSGIGVAKFYANPNGKPTIHSHAHGGQTFFLHPDPNGVDLSGILNQVGILGLDREAKNETDDAEGNSRAIEKDKQDSHELHTVGHGNMSNVNVVQDFPTHLLNPPGILRETMDWILSCAQKPQPILALVASLSIVATVLARKVKTQTGLRTNLYLVSVAGTSAGKDHGRKCLKIAFFHAGLDDMVGGEEIASGKAVLSAAARQPASVFQIDEIGLLLKSIRSKNASSYEQEIISILMKLFSSAGSVYKGTEYTDQKTRPRQDIYYPCINLHGTTTPAPLFESFTSADLNSGYINRLLIIFSPNYNGEMVYSEIKDPPPSIVSWMQEARKIRKNEGDLAEVYNDNSIAIPMTQGAKVLFEALEKFQEQRIAETEADGMNFLWGRCWEHAAKVALVVACARYGDAESFGRLIAQSQVEIDEASAQWSIDFVKHVLGRMEYEIASRVADSEFGQLAKMALKAILDAGPKGVTERELGRVCHKFKGLLPNQRDAVIQMLVRNEEIFEYIYMPASGKGRSRKVWIASEFYSVVKQRG